MSREVIAYQLSLLGDEPKPMKAWVPPLYLWSFCGMHMPPTEDQKRQFRLQYPNATKGWVGESVE